MFLSLLYWANNGEVLDSQKGSNGNDSATKITTKNWPVNQGKKDSEREVHLCSGTRLLSKEAYDLNLISGENVG